MISYDDNRNPLLPTDLNDAPYTGIALVANWFRDGYQIESEDANGTMVTSTVYYFKGTAFFVGAETLITAWHVVTPGLGPINSLPSATLFATASADQPFFTITQPSNGSGLAPELVELPFGANFNPVGFTNDVALISNVNSVNGLVVDPSDTERYVFGLDVYLDPEAALAADGGSWDVRTAGYPSDFRVTDENNPDPLIRPETFYPYEAQGSINDYQSTGQLGSYFDTELPPAGTPIFPGDVVQGDLHSGFGQSGSPVWRDEAGEPARAIGVVSGGLSDPDAVSDYKTVFTVVDRIGPDAFKQIMRVMALSGDTQPTGTSNRITGVSGNTGDERIIGYQYADVLRGMGAGPGGRDFLLGGGGNDTYAFEGNFGNAIVGEPLTDGGISDAIYLKGIDPTNVRVVRGADTTNLNVFVDDPDTGATNWIKITSQYITPGSVLVEGLAFDDFVIDLQQGLFQEGTNEPDVLSGTEFDDQLLGRGDIDLLRGLGGNDTLIGGEGNDALQGGEDNDTYVFSSGFGADNIIESGGTDRIVLTDLNYEDIRLVRPYGSGVSFSLTIYERDDDPDVVEDKISNSAHFRPDAGVEELEFADGTVIDLTSGLRFTGSILADAMRGDDSAEYFDANDGDDFVIAYGGEDTLIGGAGDDRLQGGADDDVYIFGPGFGEDAIIDTGPGNEIRFVDGIQPVAVRFSQSGLNMFIEVGANNITVVNQYAPNTSGPISLISFGDGTSIDPTDISALTNTLPSGGPDSVTVQSDVSTSLPVSDFLENDTDLDVIDTLSVTDVRSTSAADIDLIGDDFVITPIAGAIGLASFVYRLSDGTAEIEVPVDVVVGRAQGTDQADLLLGGNQEDTLNGFDGNDEIDGGAGDDAINGGLGDDLLRGEAGQDTLTGGLGYDIFSGDLSDVDGDTIVDFEMLDALQITGLTNGDASVILSTATSTVISFDHDGDGTVDGAITLLGNFLTERFEVSSITGDTIIRLEQPGTSRLSLASERFVTSDAQANTVFGYAGDDVIATAGGADVLLGGRGADVMLAGADDDILIGGVGGDILTGGEGADIFAFDISDFEGDAVVADFITDFEIGADQIELSGFGITGLDDLSFLSVATGDAIDLGDGAFILLEGIDAGDLGSQDIIALEEGRTMSLVPSFNLHVLSDADDRFVTTDENAIDVRAGAGIDAIIGGAGADILRGEADDDVLIGGGGDDRLIGGMGNDRMTGREGADSFEFTAGEEIGFAGEFITDFEAVDRVVLEGFRFSAVDDLNFFNVASGDVALELSATRFVVFEGLSDESEVTGAFVFV